MTKIFTSFAALTLATLPAMAQTADPATIFPAPGEIEAFSYVALSYENALRINRDCTEELRIFVDGELAMSYDNTSTKVQTGVEDDVTTVTYLYDFNAVSKPGTYRVVVPEGFLYSGGEPTSALDLSYTIQAPAIMEVYPAPGVVSELSTVTVTFPDASGVTLSGPIPKLTSINGSDVTPQVSVNGNTATFDLRGTYTDYDTYYLMLERGLFTLTVDGGKVASPSMNIVYVIPRVPRPEINPAEGQVEGADLSEVTLTLPEGYTFHQWWTMPMFSPDLYSVNEDGTLGKSIGKYAQESGATASSCDGMQSITFYAVVTDSFDPATLTDGRYCFVTGKSKFSVNLPDGESVSSDAQYEYYYTVGIQDAVEAVEAAPADGHTVYTMTGIRVLDRATSDAVKALPAGLYIVNGKKMVVK